MAQDIIKSTELDSNQALSPYQKNGEVDCDDPFQQFAYALRAPGNRDSILKTLDIHGICKHWWWRLSNRLKHRKERYGNDPEWFNDGTSII